MRNDIKKQRDVEMEIWAGAIGKATDSIYGVLISHLYLEHLLDRYIRAKLPKEKGLTGKDGLRFLDKLKLAKSFGEFDSQIVDSLKKLNSIRNDCVHVFGHSIEKKSIEAYGRTLGKDYKRIVKDYPDAGTHGIAPITWFVCGGLVAYVLTAEGYE